MSYPLRALPALFLALAASPVGAQDAHPAGHAHGKAPTLGTIVFPNSGSPTAQTPFLRGIAFLHSFEYARAAESFREAQRADPGFALAYWAEALTFSHVLWRSEDLPASRAVLARLAPTAEARLAKAGTERERSFGAAVEAFYSEGTLPERVQAYADSLRRHAGAAPGDQEAAAFAAHAIMLDAYVGPPGSRAERTREAIELAQGVLRTNPDHPGATHYLIHLYDTPGMAAEGLAFARAYDKIAPDAEHALHMPSHIYLQLGLWDDVARSNERAWAASRQGGSPDWHAFSWLQYAYLQQGRWSAARGLIDTARALTATPSGYPTDARFVVPRLEFQFASETGRWTEPITPPRIPNPEPASERERGFRLFATYWLAVDAVQRRDPSRATAAAPLLAVADSVNEGGPRSPVMASNALLVQALVAGAEGNRNGYLEGLKAAAEEERKLTAFVGPPERVFALELLGAEYLARGEAEEAVRAYEDVLKVCPNRSSALLGLARARATAGDHSGATEVAARLKENWKQADPEVRRALFPH